MNNFIRKKTLSSCISFWLDVELNTAIKRVNSKTSKRPLLNNKNSTREMERIFFNEKTKYRFSQFLEFDVKIKTKSLL